MNIKQLLANTAEVEGYGGGAESFKEKPFGTIYFYNKTVKTKPNSSIIEVSMMSKAVTDKIKSSANEPARPVAAHVTRISIHGVKQETLSADELIERIRATDDVYKDKKSFPKNLLLKAAVENSVKYFQGKTIMRGSKADTYVLIDDEISDESEIRVWCTCSAYYWAFQYYNVENKVDIYGKKPEKYIPKTKRGWEAFRKNEPVRNPKKLPGVCKHILMLLAMLMDQKVIDTSKGASENILKGYRLNVRRFDNTRQLSKNGVDNLIKDYRRDRRKKLNKRKLDTITSGFSGAASGQRKGWNRNMKWNPRPNNTNGGYWSGS